MTYGPPPVAWILCTCGISRKSKILFNFLKQSESLPADIDCSVYDGDGWSRRAVPPPMNPNGGAAQILGADPPSSPSRRRGSVSPARTTRRSPACAPPHLELSHPAQLREDRSKHGSALRVSERRADQLRVVQAEGAAPPYRRVRRARLRRVQHHVRCAASSTTLHR
eukprot:SAG11_NODE_175_length_13457_cov_42.095673_8_plen_167_part_00